MDKLYDSLLPTHAMFDSLQTMPLRLGAFALFVPFAVFAIVRWRRPSRPKRVPPTTEHVIILGASSGVGRTLAVQYAQRGAHVCVVARSEKTLAAVQQECNSIAGNQNTIAAVADFSSASQMVALRNRLESEWGKLDTIAIIAGVSALKPVLSIAGVEKERNKPMQDAQLHAVEESVRIANAAVQGNFTGPYVAAVTLIPFLTRTSASPSIVLLSSAAALIPAPTRALYAATKSASLLLYQSLAIEHREIAFSFIFPSTIEGDFRKSAVDGGPTRESDPNKSGLKRELVARRCIEAADYGQRTVFMPAYFRRGHLAYWIVPFIVEMKARRKYNYNL